MDLRQMTRRSKFGAAAAAAALVWGAQMQHVQAQAATTPSGPTMDGIAWDCSRWHTVVSGDACWSIWQTYGITEAQFLKWNPAVTAGCASNFWPDYSYCVGAGAPAATMPNIDKTCNKWHTAVAGGEGCWDIWQRYGITEAQFLKWNPDVTAGCAGNFWPDYSYCVGVNAKAPIASSTTVKSSSSTGKSSSSSSSVIKSSSSSSSKSVSATPYSTRYPITSYSLTVIPSETAMPPKRKLGGQPTACITWHQVAGGQTCASIVNMYINQLTLAELHDLNPTLGDDCDGLYVGWWICVAVQPQTSERIEWYTSQTNFTMPVPTPFPGYVATEIADFTASPQQTGIPSTCQNYHQAENGDTCNSVLAIFDYITQAQFFAWNPALHGDCQGLWVGYYYCVANFADLASLPMPPTVTSLAPSMPTGAQTIATCKKWYITRVNDNCESVATLFGAFSAAEFITWNPSVGYDCSRIQQDTYYCVGIPGTPTTRSAGATPTIPSAMQTQTGIAPNCTRFWLVSRTDTCASIIRYSGLVGGDTKATDFYAWNPAVGYNCVNLLPDYSVCVSVTERVSIPPLSTVTISDGKTITGPPSSSTKSSTKPVSSSSSTTKPPASSSSSPAVPVTTPSPFMPGMVDNCVRFYFRGSDAAALFCYDIASYAGIALSNFYTWNPNVGNDCGGLWADTWYCVGLKGATPTTMSSGVPTPA